jgi:hypothetical protein
MRNKVALITSRFGSLSECFGLWLESAKQNMNFDFFVLTDIDIEYKAENIKFIKYKCFDDFVKTVDEKIGFKSGVTTPFKTADLRPAYGYLFAGILHDNYRYKYAKIGDYDFWGYVDTDMIFGNLGHYINDDILDRCDVFQTWGHFSLIRNTVDFNTLYNQSYKGYLLKNSLKLPENCMVEEGPFVLQLKSVGARIDSKVSRIADIKRNVFEFTIDGKNYKNQKFIYHNGEIRRLAKIDNEIIVDDEFMYIHFMKRKIGNIPLNCRELILTENGFFEYDEKKIFLKRNSNKMYNNWKQFTNAIEDSRYKKVDILYKLLHIKNWVYRKKTRNIDKEKKDLIRLYYGI